MADEQLLHFLISLLDTGLKIASFFRAFQLQKYDTDLNDCK